MEALYKMTPDEIALGYVFGYVGQVRRSTATADPRTVLEQVIGAALRRPPCGVAFSGGRDSSLILALATHVARRDGLPDPIPITKVFPDAPGSDETDWQELVVRHLGLGDWIRLVFTDELDLIGSLAGRHLLKHGVLWPPTIHADAPVIDAVANGSLLDGEGGDEVLGVEAHRVSPLTYLVRHPWPPRRRVLRASARALAPAGVRAARLQRDDASMPWMRKRLTEQLLATLRVDEAAAPLSFATSVRRVPHRRTFVLLARNRRILAEDCGVELSSPLLHPDVVAALARDGGALGRGDRTATLRRLVADLLPDAVLARQSKAEFGGAFWGTHARVFAENWTGRGVDPALVDPEELRRLWCSDGHHALTAALLQQAWLGDQQL